MKTWLIVLFSVLFIENLFAQWFWQNSSLPKYELVSISFVDSNYGWISGWDNLNVEGVIFRTTNGGTNWEGQSYSDFKGLPSVVFVDSLTGWAVGQNNYPDTALTFGNFVYKSTNGGKDWFRQHIGLVDKVLYCADFIDSSTGWVVGGSTIIRTTDGGSNWESQFDDTVFFNSVDFIDSVTGWVVGWSDLILKTTDGGSNWISQRNKPGNRLNSVKFVNENIGWTVGDSGRILKTTDGGTNWLLQRVGTTDMLFSVSFVDGSNGWVAGFNEDGPILKYVLLKTTNGGLTWEEQSLPNDPIIYAVHFIDYNTGWISGHSSAILKTLTGGVIPVELISFSASINGSDVELNWSTATETNNKGFEIEKSQGPKIKSQHWEKIGFVAGNGTTTEPKSYSFVDDNVPSGIYSYRVKQIDFDGSFEYSNIVEVTIGIPEQFVLYQNYPNPFNPVTKIKYSIPKNALVKLTVLDILGREVAELVNEEKPAGNYEIEFDASSRGRFSTGVYFYRLASGNFSKTRKLVLIK